MKIVNGWKDDDTDLGLDWILHSVGFGWRDLLVKLVDDLEKLGWNGQILQVKEKYGGLRFYINGASDAVHERIAQAERESYTICETCGEPGRLYRSGWWRTLCKFHGQLKADSDVYPEMDG